MRFCRCSRPVVSLGTAVVCAICAGILPAHHVTPFHDSGQYSFAAQTTGPTDNSGPHTPENGYPTYVGEAPAAGTAVAGRFQQPPPQRSYPGAAPTSIMINFSAQRFRTPAGTASTI